MLISIGENPLNSLHFGDADAERHTTRLGDFQRVC